MKEEENNSVEVDHIAEPPRMGRWISVLYRQFQSFINHALKDLDISSSEYAFLLTLYYREGVSQETLSSHLYIDKAATARAINLLESKGYVIRKKDEVDRRKNRIYITEKGLSVKGDLKKALNEWNEIITEGLDSKTIEQLSYNLREMSLKVTNLT
ncbi:MAG: MarR family transcriptional regulator [Firmicutes bacterium HGW-Firmicutes-7]|nr:MAG: MarR family transcriptional regulator [Firmicutes bacterium HGW-Firmicutes-7]